MRLHKWMILKDSKTEGLLTACFYKLLPRKAIFVWNSMRDETEKNKFKHCVFMQPTNMQHFFECFFQKKKATFFRSLLQNCLGSWESFKVSSACFCASLRERFFFVCVKTAENKSNVSCLDECFKIQETLGHQQVFDQQCSRKAFWK